MTKYAHQWIHGSSTDPHQPADISKAGALGWRVVAVVSRPGMPERVLMEREVVGRKAK